MNVKSVSSSLCLLRNYVTMMHGQKNIIFFKIELLASSLLEIHKVVSVDVGCLDYDRRATSYQDTRIDNQDDNIEPPGNYVEYTTVSLRR
jgi:hypothetical protein